MGAGDRGGMAALNRTFSQTGESKPQIAWILEDDQEDPEPHHVHLQ